MEIEDVCSLILDIYNKQVSFVKEEKKGAIFLNIAKERYRIWGFLKYPNFQSFLSAISKIIAERKKSKEIIEDVSQPVKNIPQETKHSSKQKRRRVYKRTQLKLFQI